MNDAVRSGLVDYGSPGGQAVDEHLYRAARKDRRGGTLLYEGIGETAMHCGLRATGVRSKLVRVRDACRKVRPIFGTCLDLNATVVLLPTKP